MNQIEQAKAKVKRLYNEKYETEKRLSAELKKAEEELREVIKASLPQPIWGYRLTFKQAPDRSLFFMDRIPKGTEIIDARKIITNLKEIELLWQENKLDIPKLEEHDKGIVYYRMNKVLLTAGGGLYVFKSPQIVEDEEWKMLKEGNVPERLVR